jgi:alpha-D-ribose 1-methylphosphonate 5-triphosphate synthase subunit PhnG
MNKTCYQHLITFTLIFNLLAGFCYVRGAVPQAAVDALVDDLWRQAAVKTSTQWNGA